MEKITFRCESCATLLRTQASKAGLKVRCKRCGTLVTIPESAGPESEVRTETTPSEPRKHRRSRKRLVHSTDPRSDAGWRKVRLGFILIALSMCIGVGWLLVMFFLPFRWAVFLPQSLPIFGNVLCAFVPLKGAARTLSLANLGVIVLGMALTLLAIRMMDRQLDRVRTDGDEQVEKITARFAESDEEKQVNKKLADLRKQVKAGKKDTAKEEKELRKQRDDLRNKRMGDIQKDIERMAGDAKGISTQSVASFVGFWNWLYLQMGLISSSLQIILLSFFIRTIALELGDRDLAGSCPRVAALALLTLILSMLVAVLPLSVPLIPRLFGWAFYVLGIVSFVWQGIQLIEGCILIGNHLKPKSIGA